MNWPVLGVFLAGYVPSFIWIARYIYADGATCNDSQGEIVAWMGFSAMCAVLFAVFWPLLAVALLFKHLALAGTFDKLFLSKAHVREAQLREREQRIERLEREAGLR